MKGFRRLYLAHSHDHHLGESTLNRSREAGVKFDAVENENTGSFEAMSIHPDLSCFHFPDLDHLHARSDFHSGGFLG